MIEWVKYGGVQGVDGGENIVRFRKWTGKEKEALMKLADLFFDHPNYEYTEEDLQNYLKSEGIDVDDKTFTNLICDLLEMRIAQIKEYYKLDISNPVVALILKKDIGEENESELEKA